MKSLTSLVKRVEETETYEDSSIPLQLLHCQDGVLARRHSSSFAPRQVFSNDTRTYSSRSTKNVNLVISGREPSEIEGSDSDR